MELFSYYALSLRVLFYFFGSNDVCNGADYLSQLFVILFIKAWLMVDLNVLLIALQMSYSSLTEGI